MISFEPESNEPIDESVRAALQSLPMPTTPQRIESLVRQRLRRRHVRGATLVAGVAAALLAGLFTWRPWAGVTPGPLPHEDIPMTQASPLQPEELDVLFAPPPVDPLTILARQDRASVGALNRLEGGK